MPAGPYTFPTTPFTFPRLPTNGHVAGADGFVDMVEWGADPTGLTDSTNAIQAAIEANKVSGGFHVSRPPTFFFRNGTYLLNSGLSGSRRGIIEHYYANAASNNQMRWRNGLRIQGESETGTVLKLANNTFTDPTQERFVIYQSSARVPENSTFGSQHFMSDGTTLEAYGNRICDLTIHLGTGNTGAVGINVMMHNLGVIRRVTVDGRGNGSPSSFAYAGFGAERQGSGPNLLSRITVKGCQYGYRIDALMCGGAIEHLKLEGQGTAGINVNSNGLSIRGLVFNGSVPVMNMEARTIRHDTAACVPHQNSLQGIRHASPDFIEPNSATGNYPSFCLVDAVITGSGAASSVSAIRNNTQGGKMFLRNVRTTGFARAAQETSGPVQNSAGTIVEYGTAPTHNLFSQAARTVDLPIQNTPERPYPPASQCRSMRTPTPGFPSGCVPGTDITAAFQSAIDNCPAGIDTLYFPPTALRFTVSGTIRMRGNVRHIIGNGASFTTTTSVGQTGYTPYFRIEHPDAGPAVFMDDFQVSSAGQNVPGFVIATPRDVVIIDGMTRIISNASGQLGTLYVDDVIGNIRMDFPQKVFGRQLNPDGGDLITKWIGNDGWFFYVKTETGQRIVSGLTGGRVEQIGGWHSLISTPTTNTPMYTCSNAQLSVAGVLTMEGAWTGGGFWNNILTETQTAVSPTPRTLTRTSLAPRGNGKHLNLISSRIVGGTPPPPPHGPALIGVTASAGVLAEFDAAFTPAITAHRTFATTGNWLSGDYTETRAISAAGRTPVVSTKLTPAEVNAGDHDGLLEDVGQGLATLAKKPIWIYYHEPENNAENQGTAGKTAYRAAFTRAAGIIRNNCPGVRIAICYMGWTTFVNQTYGVPEDWYPGDSVIDIVMADFYNSRGASDSGPFWAQPGSADMPVAQWLTGATWAKNRGKRFGFGEMGVARLETDTTGTIRTAYWKTVVDYLDANSTNIEFYLHYERGDAHGDASRPNWYIHHEPASMTQFARLANVGPFAATPIIQPASPVTEIGIAQPVTPLIVQPIGQVSEVGTPLAVDAVVVLPVGVVQIAGQVTESGVAQTVSPRSRVGWSNIASATTFAGTGAIVSVVRTVVETGEAITLEGLPLAVVEEFGEALSIAARRPTEWSSLLVVTTLPGVSVVPEVTIDIEMVDELGALLAIESTMVGSFPGWGNVPWGSAPWGTWRLTAIDISRRTVTYRISIPRTGSYALAISKLTTHTPGFTREVTYVPTITKTGTP